MDLFVGLATLLAIGVGTGVGVRIILRSRADQSLPELAVGISLVAFCGVTQPLAVLRVGLEGQIPPSLSSALQVVATLSAAFATLCLYLFTWRVFRPNARWAALLFTTGAALGLWSGVGTATLAFYDPSFSPHLAGRWIAVSALSFAICFGWAAFESLVYWVRLRRRQRFGLAEAMLVNRFLLWGTACAASLGIDLVLMVSAWRGVDFNHDDTTRLLVSTSGLLQSLAWWLSFAPPAWYSRWISARASGR